jgi:RNA polymerase sigma-70 factor (sigma-E family)
VPVAEQGFEEYAAARWPSLVRSAVFLGCSREEGQDVAQAALVRCHLAWSRVLRADDRDAYVYRILLNSLRDRRRRRWTGEHPTEHLPDHAVGDATDQVDLADAVHRAMAGLTREQRDVVVLRIFVDLSEQQTAYILGLPLGTVKSRLSRALTQLAMDRQLIDLTEGPMP